MLIMTASQMKRTVLPLLLCCLCQLAAGQNVVVNPKEEATSQLGGTVGLSCMVEDLGKEEELRWQRNGALINLGEGNRLNQSNLCVQNLTLEDHQVQFTCQLKRNASMSASVKINILFPPELSGEETVTMEETKETALSCSVWANPEVNVSWLRDSVPVELEKNGYTLYQDNKVAKLTITKPDRKQHPGTYTCVTQSSEFGERSKLFKVTVIEKKVTFPMSAAIAAGVIVFFTLVLTGLSRWNQISKCFK